MGLTYPTAVSFLSKNTKKMYILKRTYFREMKTKKASVPRRTLTASIESETEKREKE